MGRDDWITDLYHEHKRLLLLIALNFVGQQEAAEDVLHLAIVNFAQLPKAPANPRTYAIRTVRNMAIDMLRKRSRECMEPWEVAAHFDPTQSTESLEQDEERMQVLQRALQQLSPEDRELIRLHLQGGLTFREIGEAIEEPTQTVASRYRRSINKLRSIVQESYERPS